MWHGVWEYLIVVTLVALALHAASVRYVACTFGGAVACSILNLIHETCVAGGQVNFGWLPSMFVINAALAIPVCAFVGLPFLWLRRFLKQGVVMD